MDKPHDFAAQLHIRCGRDIEDALKQAGLAGSFLEYGEPLCIGPFAADIFDNAARAQRIAYLANALDIPLEKLRQKFELQAMRVSQISADMALTLWFEHDIFDQLILLELLQKLPLELIKSGRCRLVTCNQHPNHPRFVGLGQLSPDELAQLALDAKVVEPAAVTQAREIWQLLTRDSHDQLAARATTGFSYFPFLAAALQRYFAEYPGRIDGLSLSQLLALQALAAGKNTPGAIFRELALVSDPQPFSGDQMFWPHLHELAAGPSPAIVGNTGDFKASLELTEVGQALLRGEHDWFATLDRPRHFGGVTVQPNSTETRFDRVTNQLTFINT